MNTAKKTATKKTKKITKPTNVVAKDDIKTPKKLSVKSTATKKPSVKKTIKKTAKVVKKTTNPKDLKSFLLEGLNEIYSIEKYLENQFPSLIQKASSENLKQNLQDHLEDIKENISVLEKIFSTLETNASEKKVNIDSLVMQEDSVFKTLPESIKDAALLLSCQKIRHHKVAFYTTLASLSKTLEENKIAKKLREIIKSEKKSQKEISKTAIENIEDQQHQIKKAAEKKEKAKRQAQKEKEKLSKKAEKEAKKLQKEKQQQLIKNTKIETEYDD